MFLLTLVDNNWKQSFKTLPNQTGHTVWHTTGFSFRCEYAYENTIKIVGISIFRHFENEKGLIKMLISYILFSIWSQFNSLKATLGKWNLSSRINAYPHNIILTTHIAQTYHSNAPSRTHSTTYILYLWQHIIHKRW